MPGRLHGKCSEADIEQPESEPKRVMPTHLKDSGFCEADPRADTQMTTYEVDHLLGEESHELTTVGVLLHALADTLHVVTYLVEDCSFNDDECDDPINETAE